MSERTRAAMRQLPPGRRGRRSRVYCETVRGQIRQLREEGMSLRQIAAGLDDAGVQTASGGLWRDSSIRRVLSSS